MNSIDLSPFYRNSIGYDRVGALINNALRAADSAAGYPPYNIEMVDPDHYTITVAVAGFNRGNLDIAVENGVLTIVGNRGDTPGGRRYLHQGIASRTFERRFNLAEYIEVKGAELRDGLLTVNLKRELPEAMKPRSIPIGDGSNARELLEHDDTPTEPGDAERAA